LTDSVVIADYGAGNILSLSRAFEKVGADVTVSNDENAIAQADRLILPGVGAFGHAMAALGEGSLIDPVRQFAESGRPFLGICLGMQMMMDQSEEFGQHEGLGLIAGRVTEIPNQSVEGVVHKIPHIGWNTISPPDWGGWHDGIFADSEPFCAVYFVHSYRAEPEDDSKIFAECRYGGHRIVAAIGDGPLVGCQFHPEKSGPVGLQIIKSFMSL
jgi:glutamine amidotransferase